MYFVIHFKHVAHQEKSLFNSAYKWAVGTDAEKIVSKIIYEKFDEKKVEYIHDLYNHYKTKHTGSELTEKFQKHLSRIKQSFKDKTIYEEALKMLTAERVSSAEEKVGELTSLIPREPRKSVTEVVGGVVNSVRKSVTGNTESSQLVELITTSGLSDDERAYRTIDFLDRSVNKSGKETDAVYKTLNKYLNTIIDSFEDPQFGKTLIAEYFRARGMEIPPRVSDSLGVGETVVPEKNVINSMTKWITNRTQVREKVREIILSGNDTDRLNRVEQLFSYIINKYAEETDYTKVINQLKKHSDNIAESFERPHLYYETLHQLVSRERSTQLSCEFEIRFISDLVDSKSIISDPAFSITGLSQNEKKYVMALVLDNTGQYTRQALQLLIERNRYSDSEIVDTLRLSDTEAIPTLTTGLAKLNQAQTERSLVSVVLRRDTNNELSALVMNLLNEVSDEDTPSIVNESIHSILSHSEHTEKMKMLKQYLASAVMVFDDLDTYLDTVDRALHQSMELGRISDEEIADLRENFFIRSNPSDSFALIRANILMNPKLLDGLPDQTLSDLGAYFTKHFSEDEKVKWVALQESYSVIELLGALVAKTQFNENLSVSELVDYLQRGDELIQTLADETQSFSFDPGEDLVALMWYLKAKEGANICIKGATRLQLDETPGLSGHFINKYRDAGGVTRSSTHFQSTRIIEEGFGRDIWREDLREKTPFGMGSLLVCPIVKKSGDRELIQEVNDLLLAGPAAIGEFSVKFSNNPELLKELSREIGHSLSNLEVAMIMQKHNEIDFDLGLKLETSGFKDSVPQTLAHIGIPAILSRVREDLQEKPAPALSAASKEIQSKRHTPKFEARREGLDSLPSDQHGLLLQLAKTVTGFSTQLVPRWRPTELKLASTAICGGTYTELLAEARAFVHDVETSENVDASNQEKATRIKFILDQLNIPEFSMIREGNEHTISQTRGYIAA